MAARDTPPIPMRPADRSRQTAALVGHFLEQTTEHALVLIDAAGSVVAWLGASERILGYTAADMVGKPLDVLFTQEDIAAGMPAQELEIARSGATSEDDRWHVRKDGTHVWVTGTVTALRDEAQRLVGFAKLMRDRTDLKTQLEALHEKAAARLAVEHEQRRLLGVVGHEIRNALQAIQASASALGVLTRGETAERLLGGIRRQSAVLQKLSQDLLDTTRVDANSLSIAPVRCDLSALLSDQVTAMRPLFDAKGVRLREILPDTVVAVEVDPARTTQALSNVLDNALKYTAAGGSVWIKLTIEDKDAVVRIEDNGSGIAAATLPRIFDLFTREERAERAVPQGLGIGLALVKAIVDAHHGSVEARSAGEDRGSEFVIRLPLGR